MKKCSLSLQHFRLQKQDDCNEWDGQIKDLETNFNFIEAIEVKHLDWDELYADVVFDKYGLSHSGRIVVSQSALSPHLWNPLTWSLLGHDSLRKPVKGFRTAYQPIESRSGPGGTEQS